ncbi:MAG: hypothetical protein NT007_01615 [Candidatus Kapabacteria bacterium]|nr:hypothetical protein [Candidatus Kapabacteria bacterium]
MRNFKIGFVICGLLTIAFLQSCKSPCFWVDVTMPAYVNMVKYDNIIVDFDPRFHQGNMNHSFDASDEIARLLLSSNRFKVIDRISLNNYIREADLSGFREGKGNPKSLSKIVGTTAFIFGRLSVDRGEETFSESDAFIDQERAKKKDTVWLYDKLRRLRYSLSVSFKIIDAETSQLISMQTLNANSEGTNKATFKYRSKNKDRDMPAPVDESALFRNCLMNIINQYSRYILPYNVGEEVCFIKDDSLPEVEKARNLFTNKLWDEGIQALKKMTLKKGLDNKAQAKAHYNLGLMQMYSRVFDKAEENFNIARRLDDECTTYMEVYKILQKKKDIEAKLKQQGN